MFNLLQLPSCESLGFFATARTAVSFGLSRPACLEEGALMIAGVGEQSFIFFPVFLSS